MNLFQQFLTQETLPLCMYIKTLPNAPKTCIKEQMADGTWKVLITAPPEKDKANKELIRFFKKFYGLQLTILAGKTSRKKLIEITL